MKLSILRETVREVESAPPDGEAGVGRNMLAFSPENKVLWKWIVTVSLDTSNKLAIEHILLIDTN